jgi:hypothetical protein
MATFEITDSRRLGLERCEFDVRIIEGEVCVGELFPIEDRGTLWEYIVLAVQRNETTHTLDCVTWIPSSGAFVGLTVSTRAMNSVDRKRYAKVLPESLGKAKK